MEITGEKEFTRKNSRSNNLFEDPMKHDSQNKVEGHHLSEDSKECN